MLDPLQARLLLSECTGRDIWSLEYCQSRQLPPAWVEELVDCFESGFRSDRQTIYERDRVVNQYHGVRDLDLAIKLAEFLGVDTVAVLQTAFSPEAQVHALREAVDE